MSVSAVAEREVKTILVVDDEVPILEIVARMLRHKGHQVLEATSGQLAVDACGAHDGPIDLVVTDVTMPGVSGTDLATHLLGSYPDLKVLYISGNPDSGFGDPSGRTSFLQKPFSITQLVAAVGELLSRTPAGSQRP